VTQLTFPMVTLKNVYGDASGYGDSTGNLAQASYDSDMVFADITPEQLAASTAATSGEAHTGLTAIARVTV